MGAEFAGKVVLVTGAAQGIGAAAAQRFAQEGASVVLVDIKPDGIARVVARIRAAGGQAVSFAADISRAEDNSCAVAAARKTFGRFDIAHFNAGILAGMAGFDALDAEAFDRVVRTNLYGCFHGLKAAAPAIERGGAIVVTASIAGFLGLSENPAYAASKHGILGLVRSSAAAFAARGVRVNAICPGGVATPMAGVAQDDTLVDPVTLTMPGFRGMASAQQVAELALYLASPRASAITGACHVIDAGYTAAMFTGA